jgi:hypothetical protein
MDVFFYNFIIFDEITYQPIYTKYNFNFDLYKEDFNLDNLDKKYDIFTDFWKRNECTFTGINKVKDEYLKYFTPITPEIIYYIEKYGFSNHYGYMASSFYPGSVPFPYTELIYEQFDLIYYDDIKIRRIQDYYYDDKTRIYTKYNFDFDKYSYDFKIYSNKLVILTHFCINCVHASGVFIGSTTYGLPDNYKKYFINDPDIVDYLVNYGVTTVLDTFVNSFFNIDFHQYYIDNPDIQKYLPEEYAKEHYVRYGQFEKRVIKFLKYPDDFIDDLSSGICKIISSNSTFTGFLYDYDDGRKYIISVYHPIGFDVNDNYVFATFDKKTGKNENISTTGLFKIIAMDRFSDIMVCYFDPELSYNKNNNVDLSPYKAYKLYDNVDLNKGDDVLTIGNIGTDALYVPLYGKVINPRYSGNTFEIERPDSYLFQINISPGFSGAPIFYYVKSLNEYKIIGMINSTLSEKQFCVSMNSVNFISILNSIILSYWLNSKDDSNLVKLNNKIKNGFPVIWLGTEHEYWLPESQNKYKELVNLDYSGGLIVTNFIVGFNFKTNERIYSPRKLNLQEVFEIYGPLLQTKMYKRFIESNSIPIVIKSISYFDGNYGAYVKYFIGKFSNQEPLSNIIYGLQNIGIYNIDRTKYSNNYYKEYPSLYIEYFYYDGNKWILEEILIGNNDKSNYVEYKDNNGKVYLQNKIEYPWILLDYTKYFVPSLFIDNTTALGGVSPVPSVSR